MSKFIVQLESPLLVSYLTTIVSNSVSVTLLYVGWFKVIQDLWSLCKSIITHGWFFVRLPLTILSYLSRAGLTMVPNVPWHRAPRRKGAPAPPRKFLGCLIDIYVGNCLTSLFLELTTSYIETSYYKNLGDCSLRSNVLAVCIVCLGWLH